MYAFSYWIKANEKGAVPEDVLTDLKKKVIELGGEVLNEATPIKRRIAYPIAKEREGFFGILNVSLPADAPETLQKSFARDKRLLRLMISVSAPLPVRPARRVPVNTHVDAGTRSPKTTPENVEAGTSLQDFDKRLEEILKT